MTAIYGAGWHGKEVFAILKDMQKLNGPLFFIDDAPRESVFGFPVIPPTCLNDGAFLGEHDIIVAIGDNKTRVAKGEMIVERSGRLLTAVHPRATVWTDIPIGEGTVVFPNAIVSVEAKVGRFCIINKHATVGHGALLGYGTNMADASVCSGNVGERAFLGFHAAVLPGVNIGADAVVGAGAVVTKDVPDGVIVTGVPARLR